VDTQDTLTQARERAEARLADHKPIEYAAANVAHRKQKAALTRAVNSGDADKVALTVVQTVRQWREAPFNGAWPDDWSRWQCALDDALGYGNSVLLEDIR
jgi:hypothetical protein